MLTRRQFLRGAVAVAAAGATVAIADRFPVAPPDPVITLTPIARTMPNWALLCEAWVDETTHRLIEDQPLPGAVVFWGYDFGFGHIA